MNLPTTILPAKWARAKINREILTVDSRSGYRGTVGDPLGVQHDFCADVDNGILGSALLDCLAHSRFLDEPELRAELFHPEAVQRSYATWVERLMEFGSYKTRRALFKQMMSCSIKQEEDTITITPSHHEKLEGWSGMGFTDADNVVISASEPPAVIGAALREALRRCT
jgi:hypothetical protein